ncbi:MAG TPA: MFS transporter [Steroidobacteraceae bacterium]|nr:MFS transporter [Steroidobacteraceae bacterium]
MLFLGFGSGLPYYLVYGTLSAWLRQDGIARGTISMLAWVSLISTFKFLWAPFVDRVRIPGLTRWLGRRRSWMMVGQVGIIVSLADLCTAHPAANLVQVALGALLLAFFMATQDIAMDAWRIESAPDEEQGAMAAAYQVGYRAAIICSTAGALGLAQVAGWHVSYATMAALGFVGVITTLMVREPHPRTAAVGAHQEQRVREWLAGRAHWPHWAQAVGAQFVGAVVCPLTDFLGRFPVRIAALLLLLIGSYRLTDFAMGVMANPFYIDHGYTLGQIATVVKFVGLALSMFGVVLSGVIIARFGIVRAMILGSALIISSNLAFSWLATTQGPTIIGLGFANGLDAMALALHGTALIAFLSALTSARYTATQYALFSSLYALPGKVLEGASGHVVDRIGYPHFFLYTASLSLPALLLIFLLTRPAHRHALPGVAAAKT